MNQLRRCILTPIDSLVVEGASMARIFLRHRSMAFSGISTFGTMFPFVPLLLMTLYPRKSKPSVTWVTFVFSSDNVSPMVLRNPPSSSLMAWAPAFGRCFRSVDFVSDGHSKLIPVDKETNHQIVHAFHLGKADRPAYQPLNPR